LLYRYRRAVIGASLWAEPVARLNERGKGGKLTRTRPLPRRKLIRQFALVAFIAFFELPSNAAERWETLPPTPAPIATDRSGEAEANGIKIH
jgi:hypothetical protein